MQTKNVALIVLGVVMVGFVLLVLGGIKVFKNSSAAEKHAEETGQVFLHHLAGHRYPACVAMLAPPAHTATAISDLKDVQELLEKRYGKSTGDATLIGWHLNDYNGVSTAALSFNESFDRGGVRVNIQLVRTDNGWLVQNYSPQLGATSM